MTHPGNWFRYLFLVFILLGGIPLLAQRTIDSINFIGLQKLSAETFIDPHALKLSISNESTNFDSLAKSIVGIAMHQGYFRFSIDSVKEATSNSDSTKVSLTFFVKENNPFFLRNYEIENTDSITNEKLIPFLEVLKGEVFNPSALEKRFNFFLTEYELNGFPFAKLQINSITTFHDSTANKDFADIHLKIDKGRLCRYERIEIAGNKNSREEVILRAANVKEGDIYKQTIIDNIPKLLNKLRFFEPVTTPEFYIDSKNKGVLRISIKEKQTNSFDGVLGFIPSTKTDEPGYLTGLVDISLRNLFGSGRGLAAKWSQLDRFSQELEIKYLEPYFLGFPFNINIELYQKKQDTSYVTRKFGGSIDYLANDSFILSLFLFTESVIPSLSDYSIFTVYNSLLLTTGLTFKYDTMDDPLSPKSGLYFYNSYGYTQKKISGPAEFITQGLETEVNFARVTADVLFFYQLFNRQVIALGFHARELQGNQTEISDLFKFGGAKSLRGYREDQFYANRVAYSNSEYRFLIAPRSYLFAFLDYGYYLRRGDEKKKIIETEAFKMGYGLGISLETNLGILSVSFALAQGDAFKDLKIHFGIVNEF